MGRPKTWRSDQDRRATLPASRARRDLIDAHAHLDDARFREDIEEVVARAAAAGLDRILSCGEDARSSASTVQLAHRHPIVRAAVGVHPHRAGEWRGSVADAIRELARDERVVAVGEIGMDFSGRSAPREQQETALLGQLTLARELDLPVVVHVRDAGQRTRELIDRGGAVRGMVHCYSESADEVPLWIDRGFYISFAGNSTYPSSGRLRTAACAVPLDRILVETDAPYLQPQARRREKRNEPAFVLDTLASLAEARGEDPAWLGRHVAGNAARLLGPGWV
jgi:TatD DNase family protein